MALRLLATYLTITALALAVIVIPLGGIFADREHDRLLFDIERDAQAVASLVEDDLEVGAAPELDTVLADYAARRGRIVVVDSDGISVADSDAAGGQPRDFSTRPEIVAALDGGRSTGTRPSETLGTDLMFVAVPVASGGTVHGAVRITYPTSTLDARVRDAWIRLALLSMVVLAVVAGVGTVFARGVTRPVRRLQAAAGRLAAGDLAVRVDTDDGPPELRALAETFNRTSRQLAQLVDAQQRFVADASHQLRTPLTALRLRLETLVPAVSASARPKLESAIAETNRLGRLVHSLLALARSDATAPTCDSVDLGAAVVDRFEAWRPVASDEAKTLSCDCPPHMWVEAVPGAIEQILDNLLSNAMEAAPVNSTITIAVVPRGDVVEVHVIDRGPGMSAEARRLAFGRFWRPPRESGSERGDGFGLGLSIVHQLATRCGGDARLDPGPDGRGIDAVVELRTAAQPYTIGVGAADDAGSAESLPSAHLRLGERSQPDP